MLRQRARAFGIEPRVEFAGFLDRAALRHRLQQAAVFVSPSDYEGFPLTLLEAMACWSARGDAPAPARWPARPRRFRSSPWIDRRRPGSRNAEAVLAGPAAAAERSLAARRLVEARYAWDSVVDALEAVYRRAARLAA